MNFGHANALARASNNWSICCSSWIAEKVMRNLALSTGTVGGLIALIRNPCLNKALLTATAFSGSPINTGWMGEDEASDGKPNSPAPVRKYSVSFLSFSLRQVSVWTIFKLVRVASAMAGGKAVV
jgi:hypothetical protein